jgi:hypothetical protein
MTPDEEKEINIYNDVHCFYGFESWGEITNKIGKHKPGDISEERIDYTIYRIY